MEDNKIFSTRDLTLAATLVTHKFLMEGVDLQIEGTNKRPVGFFRFSRTQELEDVRRRYSQGLLSVEPKTFMTNIHSLKADVENCYKNPTGTY
ncbi:MAG: hypothetical protein Q7K40_01210 [bacterium]|nr:hypothetical protein [bacterium]